jgi:hypothetical protein
MKMKWMCPIYSCCMEQGVLKPVPVRVVLSNGYIKKRQAPGHETAYVTHKLLRNVRNSRRVANNCQW